MRNDILERFNTRVDDDFDKKYGKAKSKGSSKIKAKLQFVSKIKAKLNRRRMRDYREIYDDAMSNVEAAFEVEKKLQTAQLTDAQRVALKEKRADYVDAVSENSEEAARLVDKTLKSSGYYSRNRVYKFVSRHPFIFRLDDQGNKKLKLQKNVLLRIITKLIPRYRAYEADKRDSVRDQVMDRFDNLVAVEADKLVASDGGFEQLSKGKVVRTVASTLENDRDVIPNLKPVKFEGASTSQTPPTASTTPASNTTSTLSPSDFVAAMGKRPLQQEDLGGQIEMLTGQVKALVKANQKLEAENRELRARIRLLEMSDEEQRKMGPFLSKPTNDTETIMAPERSVSVVPVKRKL